MKQALYRWLPRIFGCHCRADRSFYWKGEQFPICARCTGELLGILAAAVSFFFVQADWRIALLMLLPMVADGFTQLLTRYESTNPRRLVTGCLFGFGLYELFAHSTVMAFWYGYSMVK